jgi:hypothetical protein
MHTTLRVTSRTQFARPENRKSVASYGKAASGRLFLCARSSSFRYREGLAHLRLGQAELPPNSAWRHTGLERGLDRVHLAPGQCRCLTDFLLTSFVFPVGLPPYRSSLALPRPLAQVFHASLLPRLLRGPTNLILCPADAESPWADPLEEPVGAKAA